MGLSGPFPEGNDSFTPETLLGLGGPFPKGNGSLILETHMGLSGLEPPTSRLSGVRSNRLSYKP